MRTYYSITSYMERWRKNSSLGLYCGINYSEEIVTESIAKIIDDFKATHYLDKRHTTWEYGNDNDESGTGSRSDVYTTSEIDELEFKFMIFGDKVIGLADKTGRIAWYDESCTYFDYWPCLPDDVWIRRKEQD